MCGGGDIFKVAALAAGAYFLGPAMLGGLEGTTALAASGEALGAAEAASGFGALDAGVGAAMTAAEAGTALGAGATLAGELSAGTAEMTTGASLASELSAGTAAMSTGASLASEISAGTAAASQLTAQDVLSGMKTAAQLAPLAGIAAAAPAIKPSGSPTALAPVTPPPESQAASTPAPNIFKKKMKSLGDPTMTSGAGGVTDVSLGKATILGR